MARARLLKPGFFKNDSLGECDPLARILFQGLWCEADREGRLEDRPKRLKAGILPYDDCDVNALLEQLVARSFILRYEANGECFIQIEKFAKHQKPHHMELPSEIPAPEGQENKFNHTPVSPKQRARILERDGRKCLKCGATENLHVDHIKMVSKGGTSEDANLRTLCAQCNLARNSKRVQAEEALESRALTLNPSPLTLDHDSEANASAAVAAAEAPIPFDTKAAIFGEQLSWLREATGKTEPTLRSWLGKCCGQYGEVQTLAAILNIRAGPSPVDPISRMRTILERQAGRNGRPIDKKLSPVESLYAGAALALAERQRAADRRAGDDAPQPLLDSSGRTGSAQAANR